MDGLLIRVGRCSMAIWIVMKRFKQQNGSSGSIPIFKMKQSAPYQRHCNYMMLRIIVYSIQGGDAVS